MLKKIGFTLLALVVIATLVYKYAYKDHRNISTEKSDFVLTVAALQKEFVTNDSLANLKYQDKTLEIKGIVTEVDAESNGIILDSKLFGTFKEKLPTDVKIDMKLTIKGRFLGYDDLLEEFKIDQITILE